MLRRGSRFAASVPLGARRQKAWDLIEEAASSWLAPAPQRPSDNKDTQTVVWSAPAFREAALSAGFDTARVEVVEERVRWASAEQIVDLATSWWDFAARLDGVDEQRRDGFRRNAIASLANRYPGVIETTGQNHVLLAVA